MRGAHLMDMDIIIVAGEIEDMDMPISLIEEATTERVFLEATQLLHEAEGLI